MNKEGTERIDETSILVVEDEEKILRLLEIELEYEGYEVGKAMMAYKLLNISKSKVGFNPI